MIKKLAQKVAKSLDKSADSRQEDRKRKIIIGTQPLPAEMKKQ